MDAGTGVRICLRPCLRLVTNSRRCERCPGMGCELGLESAADRRHGNISRRRAHLHQRENQPRQDVPEEEAQLPLGVRAGYGHWHALGDPAACG